MQNIKNYLTDNNMTQAEFGKKIGVGQTMVQQWLSGKRPISIDKALDIEDAHKINANLLNAEITDIECRLSKRKKLK